MGEDSYGDEVIMTVGELRAAERAAFAAGRRAGFLAAASECETEAKDWVDGFGRRRYDDYIQGRINGAVTCEHRIRSLLDAEPPGGEP